MAKKAKARQPGGNPGRVTLFPNKTRQNVMSFTMTPDIYRKLQQTVGRTHLSRNDVINLLADNFLDRLPTRRRSDPLDVYLQQVHEAAVSA